MAATSTTTSYASARRAGNIRPLLVVDPSTGLSDIRHHVFWTEDAEYVGAPVDGYESEHVEWVPLAKAADLIASGDIRLANTATALLMPARTQGV